MNKQERQELADRLAAIGVDLQQTVILSPAAIFMNAHLFSRAAEALRDVDDITPERLDAFRRAWHEADAEGAQGDRVRRGMEAAQQVGGAS